MEDHLDHFVIGERHALADILGVTRQTIIAIENNKYDPTLELAMKISEYFKLSVNEIFQLEYLEYNDDTKPWR